MLFMDGTQKEVGLGKQAIVYYYKGYAYKVFNNSNKDWIDYEVFVQNEILKTNLPVIKYHDSNDCYIKMDYINGQTLGSKILKDKYKNGVEDLLFLQKKIHTIKSLNLKSFKSFALNQLDRLDVSTVRKSNALNILNYLDDCDVLLHLDFHFLNIMESNNEYTIIDWVNAKLGNPLFDYARTYVIMNEFAFRLSKKYLSLLRNDLEVNPLNLDQAIYVMALFRLNEEKSERTLNLISELEETMYKKTT